MFEAAIKSTGALYHLLRLFGVSPQRASDISGAFSRPVAALILFIVFTLIGILIAKVAGRALRLSMKAMGPKRERTARRTETLVIALARLIRAIFIVLGIILGLGALGINLTPFIAGATIVGAIVAFGAQNLIKDFLGGFLLVSEDQLAVGDEVIIGSTRGKVEAFSLRITTIRAEDGTLWYVANGDVRVLGSVKRGS